MECDRLALTLPVRQILHNFLYKRQKCEVPDYRTEKYLIPKWIPLFRNYFSQDQTKGDPDPNEDNFLLNVLALGNIPGFSDLESH